MSITKVVDKIANPTATVQIKFEPFTDPDCTTADGDAEEWLGDYLPVEVAINYANEFVTPTSVGSNTGEAKWSKATPPSLDINLEIIEGLNIEGIANDFKGIVTGTTPGSDGTEKGFVMTEVDKLKDLVYDISGAEHAPRYIKVSFGEIIFKGRCKSFKPTYKSFDRFGRAQRASLSLSFGEEKSEKKKDSENALESPDMTHYYVVDYGETLPIISNKTYGTPDLYIELAKINGLNSFRSLPAGTRLTLPPLINK
ncbi:LysM peptidoglycan-binding domain-containing protein [Vicingaceae bacterium]|nr:LysM peptidoglycan-binding domain-containing protein [Vicingaceae bacterium]